MIEQYSCLRKIILNRNMDFMKIWDKQAIPAILSEQLIRIFKVVFNELIAQDRLVQDVSEWAKNNACWNYVSGSKMPNVIQSIKLKAVRDKV